MFECVNRFTVTFQDLKLILTELSEIEVRQENFILKNYKKLKKLLFKKISLSSTLLTVARKLIA